MSIQIFCPFFKWVVILLLSCNGSLYIIDTSPLSCILSEKLSLILWVCFHLLDDILWNTKVSKFNYALLIFSLMAYAFSIISKNPLPTPRSQKFTPMFSSKSFSFSYCIGFDPFWFVYGVWKSPNSGFKFIFVYVYPLSPHHMLTNSSFPIKWSCILVESQLTINVRVIIYFLHLFYWSMRLS